MTDPYVLLAQATGFDWDDGNVTKNWKSHTVTTAECEEVFFGEPLVVRADVAHSEREARYAARTHRGRTTAVGHFHDARIVHSCDFRAVHEPSRTGGVSSCRSRTKC